MKPANSVLSSYGISVFEIMARLAREHGAINLGQGAPDEDGPADVIAAAGRALTEHSNQYPPLLGVLELRKALAAHDRRFYGLEIDPEREVIVTLGATEALACAMFALIEPGDEAVLFEPLYDSYLPILRRAGGIPKLVRLEAPDWRIPRDALEAAFSPRTKFVLLNTPMNPVSKVFDDDELQLIAELCHKYDCYAVCDEVYEHMVYDGRRHRPLMSLPGMRERTIRIGSAGKIFPLTGWKIGFMIAAPAILAVLAKAHQFLTFTAPPNLQRAVAFGLDTHADDLAAGAAEMQRKRDLLGAGLKSVGFATLPSQGTYFLTVDIRSVGFNGSDDDFCRRMITDAKVGAIPISAFYTGEGRPAPDRFVRFCFAKTDAVLGEACARLGRFLRG